MKRSRKRRKKRGRGGTPKTKRKTFDLQKHRKAMAGLKKEIDQLAAAQAQQQAAEWVKVKRPSKAARILGIQNTNLPRARIESARDPNAVALEFGTQATANIFRGFLSKKPTLTFDRAILMLENATADTADPTRGDLVYNKLEDFAKSKMRTAEGYRKTFRPAWKRAKQSAGRRRRRRKKRRRTRKGRGPPGTYETVGWPNGNQTTVYTPNSSIWINNNISARSQRSVSPKVGKFFGVNQQTAKRAQQRESQRAKTSKLLKRGGKRRRRRRRTRRRR